MKKKLLVFLTAALLISSASFAQGFHLGIKGGANGLKVDGKSFREEFRFGYNLGAWAEINLSKKVGIQPEVLWNQTNFRTADQFNDIYPEGTGDVRGDLNYLSIPVLLNYRPVKLITLQAGPQFGILLDKNESLFENGQRAFKKGDFSMLGGAQLNIGAIKVGARYVIGLTNINDIDNQDKWKNQGFQVYLGLRII
jgi:hypothetical protein